MLVTIVLRRPRLSSPKAHRGAVKREERAMATTDAAQAVIRFSPLALGCVVAIVVTGTYMAWRDVGTLVSKTATTYGRLLLLKIAGLCMLIGLGYLARRRIADGLQAPVTAPRIALRRLRRAHRPGSHRWPVPQRAAPRARPVRRQAMAVPGTVRRAAAPVATGSLAGNRHRLPSWTAAATLAGRIPSAWA